MASLSSKSLDDAQFPLIYMQISHSTTESTLKHSPIFWTHVPLSPYIYSTFQPSWIAHYSPSVGLPLWQCRRPKRLRFDPWVGKIPRSRQWQPAPVVFLGKSHGQRSLVDHGIIKSHTPLSYSAQHNSKHTLNILVSAFICATAFKIPSLCPVSHPTPPS